MNSLPDIVIIDFCDWLYQLQQKGKLDFYSLNNKSKLEKYAKEYLDQKEANESGCQLKELLQQFASSDALNNYIEQCKLSHTNSRETKSTAVMCDYCNCIDAPGFRNAFYQFTIDRFRSEKIPPYYLARDMCNIIAHGGSPSVMQSPPFLQLMTNLSGNMANEIDFLNWLSVYIGNPDSITKMPSSIYEKYVNLFIKETKKGNKEKKQLMKAYRHTGWQIFLNQIKNIIMAKNSKHNPKSVKYVMRRYLNNSAPFKCIILPLSEKNNQQQYQALINNYWEDLNSLSSDYLDIYYSESDFGKTGYDIARQICSLPLEMQTDPPCIIIWENWIGEAQSISLNGLDCDQIFDIIQCIVKSIKQNKNLNQIIEEGNMKKLEKQAMKNGGTVVNGSWNNIGDNISSSTVIIHGNDNAVNIRSMSDDCRNELLDEIEKAKTEIKKVNELTEEQKQVFNGYLEEAKKAIKEKSEKDSDNVRNKVSGFLSAIGKAGPILIGAIANLTKILTFLGIPS